MRTFAFLCALGAGTASFAGFSFNFDANNDPQGWTDGSIGNGFAAINVNVAGPSEWQAPGQLHGTDHGSYAYLFSPDLGGGHGNLFNGLLTLDYYSTGTGDQDPFIVLMSSTAFLVLENTIIGANALEPYSFALNSGSGEWYFNSSQYYNGGSAVAATDADFQAVLADLRHIGVSSDIVGGGDNVYLDNVNAVPEPATLAILAIGALAARRRKA